MKIIKEGKLKEYYFKCEECSCEFIADETEVDDSCEYYNSSVSIICPCCQKTYCKGEIFTDLPKESKIIDIDKEIRQIADIIVAHFFETELSCTNCDWIEDKQNFCSECRPYNWKILREETIKIAIKIFNLVKRKSK